MKKIIALSLLFVTSIFAGVDNPNAAGGIGDFLADGSIPMTGNLEMGTNWISNDGDNEGISINPTGGVKVVSSASEFWIEDSSAAKILMRNSSIPATNFLFQFSGPSFFMGTGPSIGITKVAAEFDSSSWNFNAQGWDYDFLVTKNGADPALFVQGSDGKVGVGTVLPEALVHEVGAAADRHVFEYGTNRLELGFHSVSNRWAFYDIYGGTTNAIIFVTPSR